MNFFFSICFMSVNDIVKFAITDDFEQWGVSLPQLDKDLSLTDYVDGLTDVFIYQWDMSRSNRRSGRTKPKW
jgi:hypothetical protein